MTSPYDISVEEELLADAKPRRFPFIKFSIPLENEFRKYRHQRLLDRVPAVGSAALIIFLLFAFLDMYTLPEPVYFITTCIRLFIVCPLIGLVIVAARLDWSIGIYSSLYMVVYVVAGLSVVLIIYTARIHEVHMPYDGVLLHLVFGYFLMGAPYKLATLGGILVSTGYLSLELLMDAPIQELGSNAAFIVTLNFMGAVGSYMQERSRRSLFLNKKLIELAQAKDEREIASRTRLLATASHDLRQPLHAMNLLVESLESQVPKGDSLSLTRKLKLAINQLSQLLSSLLNISRLNAGIVEVNATQFDLSTLVKSLLPEQELRASELGMTIKTLGPMPCLIKSDPVLVERIFRNLCENVFEHANAKEISITWFKKGDSIVLEIEDNGQGIPEDDMDKIFEEFHQADESNRQGMGLGLAIVKQLSNLMEIDCGVRPGKNSGACFWVSFPQAYSVEQAPVDIASQTSSPQSEKKILLVDDDTQIVEACKTLLEKWGYQVRSALNPGEALDAISSDTFDMLICDYRFAGHELNGIELILSIRDKVEHSLPAILITADTQQEVSEEVSQSFSEQDSSMTGIAFKPLAPAKLKLMIQHYCN